MTQIHPGYVVRAVDDKAAREEILAARAARQRAYEEMGAYVSSLPVKCDGYVSNHWDGSFYMTGVKPKEWPGPEEHAAMGVLGYKWRPKHGKIYTPDKTSVKGKALAKDLSAFVFGQPYIQGLGGIISVSDAPAGTRPRATHYFTGWHFWIYDTGPDSEDLTIDTTGDLISMPRGGEQVFAGFGPSYLDERKQQEVIDAGDRWRPARLSEYHIAREVHLTLHPESTEDEPE